MNTAVILVVSKQPLKCMEHYGPPNMKVVMGVGSPSFLILMMLSSLGRGGKELAKQATSCGRLMTCPL